MLATYENICFITQYITDIFQDGNIDVMFLLTNAVYPYIFTFLSHECTFQNIKIVLTIL